MGIGFAIPVNMVRSVVDQILAYGEVRRGKLGVAIQDLTPDLSHEKGLPADQTGAVITKVDPGSAAERGGLRAGDVVTAIGVASVRTASDLRNKIGLLRVGDIAELQVLRNGRSVSLTAKLAEREAK